MANWLGTWKYRHKITVDATKIDTADLTWFPVIIHLNTTAGSGDDDVSDIFDELTSDANRTKIALTTTDGTTQLYAEIEKWDDANETAILHVSKTGWVLDYDADTELYIYFDSEQDANTTYIGDTNSVVAESVWDSNFKMVQHMADGADTSHIYDSTANDKDGTKLSANNPLEADAKIGRGQLFSSDYIDIDTGVGISQDADFTVSVWINKTADVDRYILTFAESGYVNFSQSAGTLHWFIYDGADRRITEAAEAGWHCMTMTYDRSELKFYAYLDGVYQTSATINDPDYNYATVRNTIGMHVKHSTLAYNSEIDEIQASDIIRSAAWIKATYNSGIDTLIKDYAAKEEIAAAGPANLKSYNGLAIASMKSIMGLGIADIKSINGLA